MKRYFFRVFVSLVAFAIGIFAVWFLVSKNNQNNHYNLISVPTAPNSPVSKELNGKIEVSFNDFIIKDRNYFAELIVENNTNESVFYRAYELNENDDFALYKVKVNGKEVDQMWCGTGSKLYEIKSGESKIFRASIWAPAFKLKNLKNTQIGFYLSTSSQNSGEIFWSEPFSIPDEIKQDIIKKSF